MHLKLLSSRFMIKAMISEHRTFNNVARLLSATMRGGGELGHMHSSMLQVWMIKVSNSLSPFKAPRWQFNHLLNWKKTLNLILIAEIVLLTLNNFLSQPPI